MPRKQASPRRVLPRPTVDKSHGRETGMGVCSYLAMIFETNELLAVKGGKKRTDDQILALVREEFPDREGAFFTGEKRKSGSYATVNQWRIKYNAGKLTRGIPPKNRSFRYNSRGEIVDHRTGKYPLLVEEVNKLIREHSDFRAKTLKSLGLS